MLLKKEYLYSSYCNQRRVEGICKSKRSGRPPVVPGETAAGVVLVHGQRAQEHVREHSQSSHRFSANILLEYPLLRALQVGADVEVRSRVRGSGARVRVGAAGCCVQVFHGLQLHEQQHVRHLQQARSDLIVHPVGGRAICGGIETVGQGAVRTIRLGLRLGLGLSHLVEGAGEVRDRLAQIGERVAEAAQAAALRVRVSVSVIGRPSLRYRHGRLGCAEIVSVSGDHRSNVPGYNTIISSPGFTVSIELETAAAVDFPGAKEPLIIGGGGRAGHDGHSERVVLGLLGPCRERRGERRVSTPSTTGLHCRTT